MVDIRRCGGPTLKDRDTPVTARRALLIEILVGKEGVAVRAEAKTFQARPRGTRCDSLMALAYFTMNLLPMMFSGCLYSLLAQPSRGARLY